MPKTQEPAKQILLRNTEAVRLANCRSDAEHRGSAANAAAATIIEALSGKPYANNKPGGGNWQEEIVTKNSP